MPEQLRPLHRSRQSRHESPEPSRSGIHAFPTCAAHLSAFLWKRNGRGGFSGSGYSREGAHFAANRPMTIHAALFSPSFLWKEVPRRGGGWPRETVLPHSRKPTPPRFARLPLPEEGARMIFKETLIKSLSFTVRISRFHTYAAHFSAFLICLSYRQCPIRPFGAPSPRGEGWRYGSRMSPSH